MLLIKWTAKYLTITKSWFPKRERYTLQLFI